jgi:prevent-host-death family protein
MPRCFHCDAAGIPHYEDKDPLDDRSYCGTILRLEVKGMKISKDIKPITYLKSKAPDLLKQINETHRPVVITQNGEPRAVLQDPESYDNMRNAIGILKLISQGEQDVKEGRSKPQEEVFTNIENLLKEKMK